jgi:hypothetical protein
MTTDDFLSAASDFNVLSLRDLLAAKDHFHLHLIAMADGAICLA